LPHHHTVSSISHSIDGIFIYSRLSRLLEDVFKVLLSNYAKLQKLNWLHIAKYFYKFSLKNEPPNIQIHPELTEGIVKHRIFYLVRGRGIACISIRIS
jgi:hypothetical protein